MKLRHTVARLTAPTVTKMSHSTTHFFKIESLRIQVKQMLQLLHHTPTVHSVAPRDSKLRVTSSTPPFCIFVVDWPTPIATPLRSDATKSSGKVWILKTTLYSQSKLHKSASEFFTLVFGQNVNCNAFVPVRWHTIPCNTIQYFARAPEMNVREIRISFTNAKSQIPLKWKSSSTASFWC